MIPSSGFENIQGTGRAYVRSRHISPKVIKYAKIQSNSLHRLLLYQSQIGSVLNINHQLEEEEVDRIIFSSINPNKLVYSTSALKI